MGYTPCATNRKRPDTSNFHAGRDASNAPAPVLPDVPRRLAKTQYTIGGDARRFEDFGDAMQAARYAANATGKAIPVVAHDFQHESDPTRPVLDVRPDTQIGGAR